jgi:dolichol-phosphate mannosyltransferase
LGALFNIVFAGFLYEKSINWAIAGTAGALTGAIWNYALSSVFTWKKVK